MVRPVTETTHPKPTDLDPPPSYDYSLRMDQFQNQNQAVPLPPKTFQQNEPRTGFNQNTPGYQYHQYQQATDTIQSDCDRDPRIRNGDDQYSSGADDRMEMKNLCWLHAIAFYDMIASVLFIVSVSLVLTDQRIQDKDRKKIIPGYTFVLFFLAIQFLMGAILFAGLRHPKESTKLVCLQGWLYGAYLLICKDLFLLVGIIFNFSSGRGLNGVVVNIINIMVRTLAVLAIRKYVDYLKLRLALGNGTARVITIPARDHHHHAVRDMGEHYMNPGRVWHVPMRSGENVQPHQPQPYAQPPPPPYNANMAP